MGKSKKYLLDMTFRQSCIIPTVDLVEQLQTTAVSHSKSNFFTLFLYWSKMDYSPIFFFLRWTANTDSRSSVESRNA